MYTVINNASTLKEFTCRKSTLKWQVGLASLSKEEIILPSDIPHGLIISSYVLNYKNVKVRLKTFTKIL